MWTFVILFLQSLRGQRLNSCAMKVQFVRCLHCVILQNPWLASAPQFMPTLKGSWAHVLYTFTSRLYLPTAHRPHLRTCLWEAFRRISHLGRAPRGHAITRFLRGIIGRVLETAFEKVLRRVLRRCLAVGSERVLRRVLRRESKKGLSRRHLEGGNTPFREYDPVGVRPSNSTHCKSWRTAGVQKCVLMHRKTLVHVIESARERMWEELFSCLNLCETAHHRLSREQVPRWQPLRRSITAHLDPRD